MNMTQKTCSTFAINIYIAGNKQVIEQTLRQYCMDTGFCITVTPTNYIYTGGEETGFIIGIRNYPRFPANHETLVTRASTIAKTLMTTACQNSCMIEYPDRTLWMSSRDD